VAAVGFDPASFILAAKRSLAGTTEADLRAAAGRAYYAAYGTMRARLCAAKALPPDMLFKRRGRHRDVAKSMGPLMPFKGIAPLYNGLLTLRESADYAYGVVLDRAAVTSAVASAEHVVTELQSFKDSDFLGFPLSP
jgi:hypothetical protein